MEPRVIRYSTIQPEPVRWLWPGRLPLAKLAMLEGDPAVGKSTVAMDLAAKLTTAGMLPDGWMPTEPRNVLLLRGEDAAADTVLPRFLAAGGDPDRLMELAAMPVLHDDGTVGWRMPELPTDLDGLADVIRENRAALVIIDVLMVFLSGKVNAHRDQDVRRALGPLALMAERTGATVLAVRHLNKSMLGPVLYRGGGSIGIIGAARAGLLCGPDPADRTRRVLVASKQNLAGPVPALIYRLMGDDRYRCARVSWEGVSDATAAEVLRVSVDDEQARERLDEGMRVLFEVLADGPMTGTDVLRECRQAGLSEATVKVARDAIGVVIFKERKRNGRWLWRLPNADVLLDESTGMVGEPTRPDGEPPDDDDDEDEMT